MSIHTDFQAADDGPIHRSGTLRELIEEFETPSAASLLVRPARPEAPRPAPTQEFRFNWPVIAFLLGPPAAVVLIAALALSGG